MKRAIILASVFAMVCGLACGCTPKPADSSGGGTSSGAGGGSAPASAVEEKRETRNLGTTITIATFAGNIWAPAEGATEIGDAALACLDAVKKELGVEIKVELYDYIGLLESASTTIASGAKFADILSPCMFQSSSYVVGDLVQDLSKISSLDLGKAYWNQRVKNLATIKDKTYFAANSLLQLYDSMSVCFFNKRILDECSLENPYDLVRDGKWTIAKFREMAKAATKDIDGAAGMTVDDQWGVALIDPLGNLSDQMVGIYNTDFYKKQADGTIQYNGTDPVLLDAISMAQKITVTDQIAIGNKPDEELTMARDIFMAGNALFFPFTLSYYTSFLGMDDEWGIVPLPKADESKEYFSWYDWNKPVIMVPKTVTGTDLENVGYVLDSIAYHSQQVGALTAEIIKDRLWDETAGEMLDISNGIACFTYRQFFGHAYAELGNASYSVLFQCMGDANVTPISLIEPQVEVAESILSDFMNNLR